MDDSVSEPLETPKTPPLRIPRRKPRAASKIKCSGNHPCERCTRRRDLCVLPSDEPQVSIPERYLRDLQRRVSQLQSVEEPQSQQPPRKDTGEGTEPSASSGDACGTPAPVAPQPLADQSLSDAAQPQPISHQTLSDAEQPQPISLRPASQGQQQQQPQPQQPQPQQQPRRADSSTTDTLPQYNPLVSPDLSYLKEIGGRPRYLGPTSTWSFCRRALSLLEAHSPSSGGLAAPLNTDGTAFRLVWEPKAAVDVSDLKGLPPKDYALHLYNTCKYHFGELFGIVDEASFLVHFEAFHQDGLPVAQQERLWFCSYLLLMAFGKAFLASNHISFSTRAMALLPDPAYMHDAGIPGIELLALVALYFQSIDMRSTCYQYIGQALRLAFLEGIHTHVPDDVINPEFASRCNILWWTVHIAISYHHCIILATRPLVMWLLIQNLKPVSSQQPTGPVAALLQTSTESAMSIILMLRGLAEQDMLECFLPFQLEYAFSAAMLLSLMRAILPDYVPDMHWSRSVQTIFDQMIAKNNVVARLRKIEMRKLDAQLASVHKLNFPAPASFLIQPIAHTQDVTHSHMPTGLYADANLLGPQAFDQNQNLALNEPQQTWEIDSAGMDDALFNNHDQMLDLAEQFQTEDLDPSILFGLG
ncbi:hypothetical protein N0V90_005308 [Kalmusia sp. IMI 367209]|nr:hypothetical protein N0V90_005308 [Kalmusia sp. IMI 367209]